MKRIWTKEKCKEEALKYKFRSDFNKYSGSAYHAKFWKKSSYVYGLCRKNKWLDEICIHMKK